MRIYCDSAMKSFIAIVKDWKFCNKSITFDVSMATQKPPSRFFGFFFGNIIIKNRPYLVMPTDFIQPSFYNLLMGFDLKRSIDSEIIKDIDIRTFLQKPETYSSKK